MHIDVDVIRTADWCYRRGLDSQQHYLCVYDSLYSNGVNTTAEVQYGQCLIDGKPHSFAIIDNNGGTVILDNRSPMIMKEVGCDKNK